MIGVVAGDIAGSIYEFDNFKRKDFELFGKGCNYTDDSVLAIAVAHAITHCKEIESDDKLRDQFVRSLREYGHKYPHPMGAYGAGFYSWLMSKDPKPYYSSGNGAAMRVAACGYAGEDFSEVLRIARCSAEVTHSHPEGIKGAQCTASCIWMARHGWNMREIRDAVRSMFYPLNESCDEIREYYSFNDTCQGTVPQAVEAFLESTSFEDAIRNAVSLGGDADTLGAITGGIAEAYYGVPAEIEQKARSYLPADLLAIVNDFESIYQ